MNKADAKRKLKKMCELAQKVAAVKYELTDGTEDSDDALFTVLDQVESNEITYEEAWDEIEHYYNEPIKCPYCYKEIEDISECETDKVWNYNGDHILVRVCPHCGNMIADTNAGYMRLSDTEYEEA